MNRGARAKARAAAFVLVGCGEEGGSAPRAPSHAATNGDGAVEPDARHEADALSEADAAHGLVPRLLRFSSQQADHPGVA